MDKKQQEEIKKQLENIRNQLISLAEGNNEI